MAAQIKALCITEDPDRPTTATFVGLKEAGVDVTVVCPRGERREWLESRGVRVFDLPLRRQFDREAVRLLRAEILQGRYDLLHLFSNKALQTGLAASRGLPVKIVAYRGIRKVEATLMSWMAAMLFATIPLRTFLPGSPPIGSWVDYLVVLWVVAGLVLGLVIYVLAWLRWGTRGERAAADGSIAVVAAGAGAAASVPVTGSGDGASADGGASD